MPYEPFLTAANFDGHMYAEKIAAISRNREDLVNQTIEEAVDEAKLYLSARYNCVFLFGDVDLDVPAKKHYLLLDNLVLDIALWRLCRLANVGIDLELVRTLYKDAIAILNDIQHLKKEPKWPLIDNSTVDTTFSPVYKNSRKKRSNNW